MVDPVARLVVFGTPGTAGSKSAFPIYKGTGADRQYLRTIVTEQPSKTKTSWRQAVLDEVRNQYACTCPDPDCTSLRQPFPLDEALTVTMVFTVKKPASAPKLTRTWPVARPDALKYARATEDHLTAAGVLKDDARVVDYRRLAKVFAGEDPDALTVPGAVITVWRTIELTNWQRDAVLTPPPVDLTLFDPKGFIRPVRLTYVHEVCGGVTTMPVPIAETYAANPSYYGATYCTRCGLHRPVGPGGEFYWADGLNSKVGT